jgi:sugar/nucleoside kinase (ribokinase family)
MSNGIVIGQGATAMDYVIRCSAFPKDDGFENIYSEHLTSGGSCANVLVALAHLGAETALVAQVGEDALGEQFRRELLADGVSDRWLFAKAGGSTMHTYVFVNEKGRKAILVNRGDSFGMLDADQMTDQMMSGAAVLFTDGSPGLPAIRLCEMAKSRDIPIFYQIEDLPSHEHGATGSASQFERILAMADLVCAGRDVYRELADEATPSLCLESLWLKVKPRYGLVCTAGEQGALWYDGQSLLRQHAFQVDPIDTTGAGDSFCGGLIAYYLLGRNSREDSLRFACACGAMKCCLPGPRLRASMRDVEIFVENRYLFRGGIRESGFCSSTRIE